MGSGTEVPPSPEAEVDPVDAAIAEIAATELAGIATFVTEVVRVEDVHPHLRRITFGGVDLVDFRVLGPDTFFYVLLPPVGRAELTVDQGFSWEALPEVPAEDQPIGCYYTVRSWRPAEGEVDILCVLHDPAGPTSDWVARARPGDPAALWGPRTAWAPPPGTDRYVLVADETGLPAVAAILEVLPPGTPVQVVAEVADASEQQDLPIADGIEVTWCYRDGAAPGTTTLLPDAVRALTWADSTPYVWGGGESHAMTAVRRHVRSERGLGRDAVSLVAYWRHAAHLNELDDEG